MSENAQQTADKPSEAISAPDQLVGVDLAQEDTAPVAADAADAEQPTAAKTAAEQAEEMKSNRVTLADLSAKGTALYVRKAYDESAECYAKAAEMQAALNGEMDPQNAEILFLYGRSLFKVGQSKSDVLGGRPGGGAGAEKPKKSDKKAGKKEATVAVPVKAGEGSGDKIQEGAGAGAGGVEEAKKPLFQFTGDENWDDSDEEGEGGDEEQGDDEEYDDLADAFEVLDLARVLFIKRLEELDAEVKGAEDGGEHSMPTIKHVKERLADTHDLLAEISLENERYPNAIVDCRASLKYKKELYPFESEFVAEAHFKLSLALEFASITTTTGEGDDVTSKRAEAVDQAMRDEAAAELQAAIDSTKRKLELQEVELASTSSPEENEVTRLAIGDVKEVIADMEQRLIDLKKPPIDINETLYGEEGIAGAALGGLLAGSRGAEAEAKVQEAKKTATDLSGLVRKKQKPDDAAAVAAAASGSGVTHTNGKRKAEDEAEAEGQGESGGASPKKARV